MSSLERIAALIVGVAMVTTLVLPDRQTAPVINAVGGQFIGSIKAAMGRG